MFDTNKRWLSKDMFEADITYFQLPREGAQISLLSPVFECYAEFYSRVVDDIGFADDGVQHFQKGIGINVWRLRSVQHLSVTIECSFEFSGHGLRCSSKNLHGYGEHVLPSTRTTRREGYRIYQPTPRRSVDRVQRR